MLLNEKHIIIKHNFSIAENIFCITNVKINKTDDPNYFKNYYKANRDKMRATDEKRKTTVLLCPECKLEYKLKWKTQHYRSKRHLENKKIFEDLNK